MNTTPAVADPSLALPDSPSALPFTLARWLAYAEGIILLFGACMMVSSGVAGHSSRGAAGTVVLAILSLTLGWEVGGANLPAAVILLALSISRGITPALPGAPDWWKTLPLITMVELIVFGMSVRAALRVERLGIAPIDAATRRFRMDVVVAGTFAVLSMMAMAVDVPRHNEGLQGVAEGLIVALGLLDFLLAIILFASANAARKGSSWGKAIRGLAYVLIWAQALFGLLFVFDAAVAPLRH
jgi:hypothetical protein